MHQCQNRNWDWGKKKNDLSDKNTRAILLANAASFIFQHKAQPCSTGEANLPVSTWSICYPFQWLCTYCTPFLHVSSSLVALLPFLNNKYLGGGKNSTSRFAQISKS